MFNHHQSLSIIIIINNFPSSLDKLVQTVIKQSNLLGKSQTLLLNNNRDIKVINLCLDTAKKYSNKENEIIPININKNQEINDTYQSLLNVVKGEILIFIKGNCYPEDSWLENLIKPFNDKNINIIAGEIEEIKTLHLFKKISYLIHKLIKKDKFKCSNIFDGQIANVAIKKEFLQQQKSLYLSNIKEKESTYYNRILNEVEAEIIYHPLAKVYQNHRD